VQRPLRVRAGQQGTRAQRGCTVNTHTVWLLCGSCAGTGAAVYTRALKACSVEG
jgi:hypothetical protein